MDFGWLLKLLLLILSLLLSAFFSGSEVALFTLDKKKLRELKKSNRIVGSYIQSMLENPKRLLVTILLGNTIVNISASIIAVLIALDAADYFNISKEVVLLIQIVMLTIIILFIGEVTPKFLANKFPVQFARLAAVPLYWFSIIFYPIAKIVTDLFKFFTGKVKSDKGSAVFKKTETTEITELTGFRADKGTFEEGESEIIQSIVDFKNVTTREIMTPRVDIVAVPVETDFNDLMKIITDSGHSRIPLYENNLDNITGIIYAKDLLPYLRNQELRKTLSLKKIARDAMFVPETKMINDLLHEFQEKKMHLGIVVDEYGGTAGLVSLEDIIEEIVGDIRDEFDREEKQINKLNENTYLVLGKVTIDELNELLEQDFSSENDDYDTIGGFIFNQGGIIPQQGFHFTYNNYKFTVKEVVNKRINKVLIEKLQGTSN
ncbi:MAG: hemolysin family protein [Bacteroidota bacterium]